MKKTTWILTALILAIAAGTAMAAAIFAFQSGEKTKNAASAAGGTFYVMEGKLTPKGSLAETGKAQYAKKVVVRKSKPKDFVVVLDPGHGGKDNGASRDNVLEKDVNLAIAKFAEAKLKELGYQVFLTRDADDFISLQGRVDFAAEKKADVFVSFHQNSSGYPDVKGMETYCTSESSGEDGKEFARLLHKAAVKQSGTRDRGILDNASLFVTRENHMPAVLMELGFLTNEAERKNLSSAAYQEKLAQGITEGIHTFLCPNAQTK